MEGLAYGADVRSGSNSEDTANRSVALYGWFAGLTSREKSDAFPQAHRHTP